MPTFLEAVFGAADAVRKGMWSLCAATHDESPPSGRTEAMGARKMRVLIVDPDAERRGVLTHAVSSFGYACRAAIGGDEAWALYEMVRPDIILGAWEPCDARGLELLRKIRRAEGEGARAYVILLSENDDVADIVHGIEAGADDVHRACLDPDELRARLVAASRVVALYKRLEAKTERLSRDSQRSFELARIDALTEIGNRLRMDEDLTIAWSLARRYGRRFSAALFDVDWFKAYNDQFGHLAGDELLRRIAHRLRDRLRQGDTIYRYGGEEFLVLLPEQCAAEAMGVCNRLRDAIASMRIPTPTPRGIVTVSAGVAEAAPTDDADVGSWLERVDHALYRAKGHGRNLVEGDARGRRARTARRNPPP